MLCPSCYHNGLGAVWLRAPFAQHMAEFDHDFGQVSAELPVPARRLPE